MREEEVEYFHLLAGSALPSINWRPRRVVVLVEQRVCSDWQDQVSDWIVESGCLFMMAWGLDCSSWDDSVDHANLRQFDYGEVPEDRFVMTTWHSDEPINEVFFFCLMCASHPTIDLALVTILHIAADERRDEILAEYNLEKANLAMEADSTKPRRSFMSWLTRLVGRP